MGSNKSSRILSESAGFPAPSVFTKVMQWFNSFGIAAASSAQQPMQLIPQTVSAVPANRHEAIIDLMNKGKRFDDANAIVKTAEDWNLDLELFDIDSLSVTGQSVWIDLED